MPRTLTHLTQDMLSREQEPDIRMAGILALSSHPTIYVPYPTIYVVNLPNTYLTYHICFCFTCICCYAPHREAGHAVSGARAGDPAGWHSRPHQSVHALSVRPLPYLA